MKVAWGRPVPARRGHEERRQEEAAEGAEHPDQAADGADVVREVLGDVLVDGGLADAHRDADQEHESR